MSVLNDKKYISDASKIIFFTYFDGEPLQIQASLMLTVIINTMEYSGQKKAMINAIKNGLEAYENVEDIMDLADGNLN